MTDQIIPHSRPWITQTDIDAVTGALESGELAAGERVRRLEQALASYLGREHAVAMSSGTAALYVTLASIGIGAGDEVVMPAYVCSAPLHAVRLTGAQPVLADCGAGSVHIDADTVRSVLTPRTRAIIVPHLFGGTADTGAIAALGPPVIEDIAMSIGAERNGCKAGNMGSVAAVCSFYATKMIAAGEGGMIVTDDAGLAGRMRNMIAYDNNCDDRRHFNFKLTDVAAALALSQFERLETMIARRRELARRYTASLISCGLDLPMEDDNERRVWYRYVFGVDVPGGMRSTLKEYRIMAERPVYTPLSLFPGVDADCPRAEEAWRRSLSIPLYPALSDCDAERVISAVREATHGG